MKRLLLVIAGLLVFSVASSFAAEAPVGRVLAVRGSAEVTHAGSNRSGPVGLNDKVFQGDKYNTAAGAKLKLILDDESIVTVAQSSELVVDEFVYDRSRNVRKSVVKLNAGTVRSLVSKGFSGEGSKFEVHTRTAVAGARGTLNLVSITGPDQTFGIGINDITDIRNADPGIPGSESLTDNYGSYVELGSPPTPPALVPDYILMPLLNATELTDEGGSGGGSSGGSGGAASGGGAAGGSGSSGQSSSARAEMNQALGSESGGSLGGFSSQLNDQALASLGSLGQPQGGGAQNPAAGPNLGPGSDNPAGQGPANNVLPPPIDNGALVAALTQTYQVWLAWGQNGYDLDLHLTGNNTDGTKFHVYSGNPGIQNGAPGAFLHNNASGNFGSEVITVTQMNPGTNPYRISVFNYGDTSSRSLNLANDAGAVVRVVTGGTVTSVPPPASADSLRSGDMVVGGTVVTTLTPPRDQHGNTWVAAEINAGTAVITPVNTITSVTNPRNIP